MVMLIMVVMRWMNFIFMVVKLKMAMIMMIIALLNVLLVTNDDDTIGVGVDDVDDSK